MMTGTVGNITVNMNMTTSPANQNTLSKSSGSAIRMTNENNSTPCMSNMNKGAPFADDNAKNSDINSYNIMKKKSRLHAAE
eukprot:4972187-Ditylum_brightwellii.AAC.3